jgi:hypothetical protein
MRNCLLSVTLWTFKLRSHDWEEDCCYESLKSCTCMNMFPYNILVSKLHASTVLITTVELNTHYPVVLNVCMRTVWATYSIIAHAWFVHLWHVVINSCSLRYLGPEVQGVTRLSWFTEYLSVLWILVCFRETSSSAVPVIRSKYVCLYFICGRFRKFQDRSEYCYTVECWL